MPLFKYLGGDQRPDTFGVLTPGDVLAMGVRPEWGDWEPTDDEPVRQPTSQPTPEPEPEPADTRTRPKPKPADDAKEA